MIAKYPIVTIEDPFDQDDWDNWTNFCKEVGKDVQIVGDDLTVTGTNPIKITEAIIRLDPFPSLPMLSSFPSRMDGDS